jgi:hypothetical protein
MTGKRVFKVWRQASVLLPDGEVRRRQLVLVTSDGLELYGKPEPEPGWSSPVDFTQTVEPRTTRLHVGVDIETDAGTVVITPTGGCMSCGSRMRGWYPPGADMITKWPEEVAT